MSSVDTSEGDSSKYLTRANRRAHTKSRYGCHQCKSSHIKCDEQGPPCSNCKTKGRECTYAIRVARDQQRPSENVPLAMSSRSPEPSLEQPSNVLELELMHRWTTTTYSALGDKAEEKYGWQVNVPQIALKHDFLMNGLFAFAALDIAVNEGRNRSQYIRIAMNYQGRASQGFRDALVDIAPESHPAFYVSSVLTPFLAIIIPHHNNEGLLENLSLVFSLLQSSASIALMCWNSIQDYPFGKIDSQIMLNPPPEELDADIREALEALNTFNNNQYKLEKSMGAQNNAFATYSTCKQAIFQLEKCWERTGIPGYRGLSLAFPALAGQGFTEAVEKNEPMPFLILMYWAVLIESSVGSEWPGRGAGRKLVEEICDTIFSDQKEEYRDKIDWARKAVGLPPHFDSPMGMW